MTILHSGLGAALAATEHAQDLSHKGTMLIVIIKIKI